MTEFLARLLMILILEDGSVHVAPTTMEQCADMAARTLAGQRGTIESTDGRPSAIMFALCVPAEAVAAESRPAAGGERR